MEPEGDIIREPPRERNSSLSSSVRVGIEFDSMRGAFLGGSDEVDVGGGQDISC